MAASAHIAAHELGHILGLRHHDSFSPIGAGIGVSASKYTPPFFGGPPVFPGPVFGTLAGSTVMGLASTVALNANTLLSPSFLSERSATKLTLAAIENEIGENPFVISEAEFGGDAPDMLPAVAPIPLMPMGTVNTLLAPHPWSIEFAGPDVLPSAAVVVTGSIEDRGPEVSPDIDYYGFVPPVDMKVTVEVISHVMNSDDGGRVTDWVDPFVALLDPATGFTPVAYYGAGALNGDQFESFDSILFDVSLTGGTPYVVEIGGDTMAEAGMEGIYELLIYGFAEVINDLKADYDENGIVGASDYPIWRSMVGLDVVPFEGADGNGDGFVDEADRLVWYENFGKRLPGVDVPSGAEVSPVPEPSGGLLIAIGAAIGLMVRSRTVKSSCVDIAR